MRRFAKILGLLIGVLVVLGAIAGRGTFGERQNGGEVSGTPRPPRGAPDIAIAPQNSARTQILFGDLHVHTTFSYDAYSISLPMVQGEGSHPPADACDYARHCAALDFFAITDHAEGLTPHQWSETREMVRACNAVAQDPQEPDMVAFLGWEWTQIGTTPADHYGHKNVILRDIAEGEVPTRPIASRPELFPGGGADPYTVPLRALLIAGAPGGSRQRYHDFARFVQDRSGLVPCPLGVPVRDLPLDCHEGADTPQRLFAKLDDWGFPSMVIPHGNTWGIYTPAGTTWDKQLGAHDDPDRREPLVEVFSGHGNSEEYRRWRAVIVEPDGTERCPEPSEDYMPSCWRAGEIIRERCRAADLGDEECDARAVEARRLYLDAGTAGHLTVPGSEVEDWGDAGQCRDCYMPTFDHRPGGASQYALAIRDFSGDSPKRFRFGFIASSDNHTARPGTGYKEVHRHQTTDANLGRLGPPIPAPDPAPQAREVDGLVGGWPHFERFASFLGSGGLVAVHAEGRRREDIWEALEAKHVYGTSGGRILLWFDLLDEEDGTRTPMGGQVETVQAPRFEVRAVGAPVQRPGCPDSAGRALGADRLTRLCRDECHHPEDDGRRQPIERIEVVRIRPQNAPDEPVEGLIEDPWRILECPGEGAGCLVQFEDAEFGGMRRDTVYYVRAVQKPTATINAGQLRCDGADCDPCRGGEGTARDDDCLVDAGERAWSSPIFVDFVDGERPAGAVGRAAEL